jgi:diaminopimelate epimerase
MARHLTFTKFHGCGNSFIVIDDRGRRIKQPGRLARSVCSPTTGIGADGLILVRPAKRGDVRMEYRNADGSVAEISGNGVRCLAAFVRDQGIVKQRMLTIETLAGPIRTELIKHSGDTALVRVDMGAPAFQSPDFKGRIAPALDLAIDGRSYVFVSMGNPHAVTLVDDFDFDLAGVGRRVEHTARLFPHRVNVGFARVTAPRAVRLKVWERGCGLTQACGTGACAAVVAATLRGLLQPGPIRVQVDGGVLSIEWDRTGGRVSMTGPAVGVAAGVFHPG